MFIDVLLFAIYIDIYIYMYIERERLEVHHIYFFFDVSHCLEAPHCHEVSFSASIAGALWFSDACAIGSSIKMDASVSAGGGADDAGESVKT